MSSSHRTRTTRWFAGAALLALPLAACGGSDEPPAQSAPSSTTSPATESATPTDTSPPSPTESPAPSSPSGAPGAGCPATGTAVPDGAATAPTADLDGDGAADQLWLSGGDPRTLGVATASGAVLSTEFTSAAPQAASALGQRLGDGGPAVVLLDTGRAVDLYAVVDCEIVPTQNDQGEQYTFDRGFTGYGTGVGCVDLGSGLQLVGLKAESDEAGERFTVTRTAVELADGGRTAANGPGEVVAEDAAADDPVVTSAQAVTCGEPQEPVHEPQ
ncbi:hypothetical protein MF406_00960 [Georgenia sp. TF02-10]|uniref:hypothetical protein n=1 Tax=Georgenia sp. TF02-10 TaxID=2917725 RepID=UPI001FA7476E|nr:hypothetical protein [Georgenia sp. TF02-10]UNX54902.1 hypothetical protein MF406_00960 [Georgenia sp. TF02-10]